MAEVHPIIDSQSTGDPSRHHPMDHLIRAVDELPASPSRRGTVSLIVRRVEGGIREVLERVTLTPEQGVPDDAWNRKLPALAEAQLAVMQTPVAELIANGQPLPLFGDNLFLDLDLSKANLPIGTRLRAGRALLEITPKPHNGCKKFLARFGKDALEFVNMRERRHRNLRGIYMCVIEAGVVSIGDPVEVVSVATDPEAPRIQSA